MEHRLFSRLRIALLSIALVGGLLLASAATVSAQIAPCACSSIRIDISKDVACAVTICYRISPSGYTTCVAVKPGGSLVIPCGDWQDACISLCDGGCYPLNDPAAVSRCTPTLQVGPVCCVRACLVQSPDEKCPHIDVTPVAFCLGQPCK